jgi:hypothetical protein
MEMEYQDLYEKEQFDDYRELDLLLYEQEMDDRFNYEYFYE